MARKNVIFFLGYAPAGKGLASRSLVVTRMKKAGDDGTINPLYSNAAIGGTDEFVSVPLTDNQIWEAKHFDTKSTGEVSETEVLHFHTGSLQFPGPRVQGSEFRVDSMEDLSSSSDSSINSSSSSSSRSSPSSASSASSVNSSSSSSSASSASSINSSSSSFSSLNSSSSSSSSPSSNSSSSSSSSSSNSSSSSSS
jgi:hypothetical protein